MVLKKRLDYGFDGYRAPIVPRAPRSIRRRGSHKNLGDDSKLCAFELLATVAGKLLQESESSASSNVGNGKVQLSICKGEKEKQELIDDKTLKLEGLDHRSCAESAFVPEGSVREYNLLSSLKGLSQAENDSVLEQTSALASSNVLKEVDCDMKLGLMKLGLCEVKNEDGHATSKLGSSNFVGDNVNSKVEGGPEMHSGDDRNKIGESSMANKSVVKNPIEEYVNSDIIINSESSVQLPLYRDPIPDALMQKHWNNVKIGIRDDDDNSFGCNRSSTKIRLFRSQHRRIRNMPTSKYRKVAPKLKRCERYNTSEKIKSFYRYRKRTLMQERFQQIPIKKRKLSDHSSAVAYNQDTSCGSVSNLPEKGSGIDKSSSAAILERAKGASTTGNGRPAARNRHVKFKIKSFKVPELYIEVPENASVGSLKRTVMEAVAAILGNGIRVGVVLQGKKVREDNKTLQQAGISESSNLDTLGFTLEPSSTHVSTSLTTKKFPSILPCDADQELLRSPGTPMIDSGISNALADPHLVTKFDDKVGNNELISSPRVPTTEAMDAAVPNSKALVPAPPMDADALAVVPLNPKPKRSEVSQRRTRRPFSVAEVEALVEVVEKLGTGRWRDVKINAFENAEHRTYVDLKDKWKTLVHTASISPQQRRGEPVPQELLDRVLAAHSYWSVQHQPKQPRKHTMEPLKTAGDGQEEIVGV